MSDSRSGDFATVGRDLTARLWNNSGANQVAKFKGFTDVPARVVFTHDGNRLIAGDFTGRLQVWNVKDKSLAGELTTNP